MIMETISTRDSLASLKRLYIFVGTGEREAIFLEYRRQTKPTLIRILRDIIDGKHAEGRCPRWLRIHYTPRDNEQVYLAWYQRLANTPILSVTKRLLTCELSPRITTNLPLTSSSRPFQSSQPIDRDKCSICTRSIVHFFKLRIKRGKKPKGSAR